MIAWILSKLFSVKNLTEALSKKPGICRVDVVTECQINDMLDMWQDMGVVKPGTIVDWGNRRWSGGSYEIH